MPGEVSDIFTVKDLTEEQDLIRKTIREFMIQEVLSDESSKRIENKDLKFQQTLMRKMGEIGLLGIEVPEKYGGSGLDKICATIFAQEISGQGSFACTLLAHTGIGTLPIRFFGNEFQKHKYLPKLVSGEFVAAYSLTEAGAGSDAKSVTARAVKSADGNSYILNGEKKFVTNGGFADVYTVFAQLEGAGLTAFIVERSFSGVQVGKEEHKMGIQGSSTVELILNDAVVPAENLLGEPGKGFKIAVNILNLGRFKLGAACLGGGQVALRESLDYSKNRKQFGQTLFQFGTIRQKLAHMAARVYATESMVYRTAGYLEKAISQVDADDSKAVLKAIEEFAAECSIVKVACTEDLDFIVDENVQIHGGSGFCEGNPERQYRDSRINRIFEGTNEINRMLLVGLVMKNILTGGLPLVAYSKKVLDEAMSSSLSAEPEDLLARLANYLNNARKAFLVIGDSLITKYQPMLKPKELEQHQVVLMALADYMIEIYRMESVLAATVKNRNVHNEKMIELIFHESLFKIEKLAKELIAICSEGDDRKVREGMIRRFLKFATVNQEEMCDSIAVYLAGL